MGTINDLEKRPGIRRINNPDVAPTNTYQPLGQQSMESHVIVPAFIAFIVAMICTGLVAGVLMKWFFIDGFILMVVFCLSFLVVFLKRIGVGDRFLLGVEQNLDMDIDGDGEVGYAPRDIPLNKKGGAEQQYVNMPPVESKLGRSAWEQVAVAALNKRAKLSRRGLKGASKLSHAEAGLAAKILHEKGRAVDNELNGAGWDWLIVHLPEHVSCMVERPPYQDPPTPKWGGRGAVGRPPTNQPTNQEDVG